MYLGELIEFGETDAIFTTPKRKATEDYITANSVELVQPNNGNNKRQPSGCLFCMKGQITLPRRCFHHSGNMPGPMLILSLFLPPASPGSQLGAAQAQYDTAVVLQFAFSSTSAACTGSDSR